MMLGLSFLLVTMAAVPTPYEKISIRCANAVAKTVAYVQSEEARREGKGTVVGGATAYDRALCVQSRKVPERTFVSLVQSKKPSMDGLVYVVEPSGEVRTARSVPCDESPSPNVCE